MWSATNTTSTNASLYELKRGLSWKPTTIPPRQPPSPSPRPLLASPCLALPSASSRGWRRRRGGAGLVGLHMGIPFVSDIPNIPLREFCFVGCPSFQGDLRAASASKSCRCDHSLPPPPPKAGNLLYHLSDTLAAHQGHTGIFSYCPPAYSRRQCTVLR